MTKAEYEALLQTFVGQRIAKVIYFDCWDDDGNSGYSYWNKPFHSLCWGVNLETESGNILGLNWGDQFIIQYGLDLYVDGIQWTTDEGRFDVSTTPEWINILGEKISSIQVCWGWGYRPIKYGEIGEIYESIMDVPKESLLPYPHSIQIQFETGSNYYISAATYMSESDNFFVGSDELVIFFDDIIAQNYGLKCMQEGKSKFD